MAVTSATAVRFRFVRPTVPEPAEWLPYLESAYELAQFSNFGPAATQLEARLTEAYAEPDQQAVLVANATVGLTASLLALGVRGPVIVPAFTFPATVQAIIAAGCTPVFGDIDPDTWELSADEVRRIAGEQSVAAVLHVRVYGLCRPLLEVEAAARDAGVPLVVDSAAALGGQASDATPIGRSGDVEVFSMHATKVFGIGEGGVVLAAPELAARIRRCLNFGLDGGRVTSLGINGKLSELHAAVGLAVLDRMPEYLARRRAVAEHYRELLGGVPGVTIPSDPGLAPWQTFPLAVAPGTDVEALSSRLRDEGLETRRYYWPPLHEYALFGHQPSLPVTEDISSRAVCLPVYSDLRDDELTEIVAIFTRVWSARADGRGW